MQGINNQITGLVDTLYHTPKRHIRSFLWRTGEFSTPQKAWHNFTFSMIPISLAGGITTSALIDASTNEVAFNCAMVGTLCISMISLLAASQSEDDKDSVSIFRPEYLRHYFMKYGIVPYSFMYDADLADIVKYLECEQQAGRMQGINLAQLATAILQGEKRISIFSFHRKFQRVLNLPFLGLPLAIQQQGIELLFTTGWDAAVTFLNGFAPPPPQNVAQPNFPNQ